MDFLPVMMSTVATMPGMIISALHGWNSMLCTTSYALRNGLGADAGEKIMVFCASTTAGVFAVTFQGWNRQCSAAAFAATPETGATIVAHLLGKGQPFSSSRSKCTLQG